MYALRKSSSEMPGTVPRTLSVVQPLDNFAGSALLMLWPLLVMIGAYTFYFLAIMLMRARSEVLRRERGGAWLREELARAEAA